ncbi:MAG: ABC transporter permease [Planctomycetales bacterium]|nr:ABC transporter permease [Planctomycetales bacterium]
MTSLSLFGVVPTWVSSWLTPLWLIGIGALIGSIVLLVLWGMAIAVSRIPAIGGIAENRALRSKAVPILSVVSFFVLLGFALPQLAAREGGSDSESTVMAALLLVPVALACGLGLVYLTSRRTVAEIPQAVREGFLWPVFILTLSFAAFAVVGFAVSTQPKEILNSIVRLPYSGEQTKEFSIPATSADILEDESRDPPQHPIQLNIRTPELHGLELTTDQSITIDLKKADAVDVAPMFEAAVGEPIEWRQKMDGDPLFEEEYVDTLYIRNYGLSDAHIEVKLTNRPMHPEVRSVAMTAIAVIAVFLLYILQRAALPKMSAIALATFKSELAQPLFLIVMMVGVFSLLAFIWIPYNTFGEDIKVLKDSGMVLIKVLCIIQAVWAASTSVSEEIEGRTALTVLSKPLRRRSFVLGKYLGIFLTVAIVFILLGAMLMLVTAYKPIYDAKEGSGEQPIWQLCHFEMVGVVPGLLLAFMETAILAAISVAISTRLPMLANFIICFTIYVIGHLTPLLVQSSVEGQMFEAVVFVAQLLSTLFPVLDHFSIEAAVAAGVTVPYTYLGWALLYTVIYGMIALLLALVLFEDRDLA